MLWLRALLIHPVVCVAPWVVLARLFATGSDDDIVPVVGAAFWAVPLGAAVSFVVTVAVALRHELALRERAAVALVAAIGSGGMLVLGWVGWFQAAEVDCAGRYECPF